VAQLLEALLLSLTSNPSCRAMALGSTQTLTEINTYQIYLLGRKGGRYIRLKTFPPSCDCLQVRGTGTSWSPKSLSRPVLSRDGLLDAMNTYVSYLRILLVSRGYWADTVYTIWMLRC
jgi:hypothetical protein